MKHIKTDLNKTLLEQEFKGKDVENVYLEKCQQMAENFIELENGIAVLSDLQNVYSGKLAEVKKLLFICSPVPILSANTDRI